MRLGIDWNKVVAVGARQVGRTRRAAFDFGAERQVQIASCEPRRRQIEIYRGVKTHSLGSQIVRGINRNHIRRKYTPRRQEIAQPSSNATLSREPTEDVIEGRRHSQRRLNTKEDASYSRFTRYQRHTVSSVLSCLCDFDAQ